MEMLEDALIIASEPATYLFCKRSFGDVLGYLFEKILFYKNCIDKAYPLKFLYQKWKKQVNDITHLASQIDASLLRAFWTNWVMVRGYGTDDKKTRFLF